MEITSQRTNVVIPSVAELEMRKAHYYCKARMNAVNLFFSGAALILGGVMTPILTLGMHSFKTGTSVIEWALKIIGFVLVADAIYKHRVLDCKS